MNIAENIKRIRENLGLSQSELAERIGSNRFNICNYEIGRAIPPADVYLKIVELSEQHERKACTA